MDNANGITLLDRAEVDSLMSSVYSDLGITPKDVHIKAGAEKGDGYLSFMTQVDVTTDDNDRTLHFILKSAPRVEHVRKFAPIREAFKREIYFYDIVLPSLQRFQTERHGFRQPFASVPKCYKTQFDDEKELLILENIKLNGFKLWDRMHPMNDAHIMLVFKTYGKLHAISYAMQQQEPNQYAELTAGLDDIFAPEKFDPGMVTMMDTLASKLQATFEDDNEHVELYNKLGQFKETGMMAFWKSLSTNFGKYPVILHGDCWVNNMMFKYDDNQMVPVDICLLDFQLMKAGSPVLDLAYFLYVSAPKHLLDKLDTYLKAYHASLRDALRAMNCTDCMSLDALKNEWKQYSRFGLLMSMMISKAMMSEKDEIIDFSDVTEDNMEELMNRKGKNDELVRQKMKALALHMDENGFL